MMKNPLSLLPRPSTGLFGLAIGILSLSFGLGVRTAERVDAAPTSPALAEQAARAETPATRISRDTPRPGYADVVEPAMKAVVNVQSVKIVQSSLRNPGGSRSQPFFFSPFGDGGGSSRSEPTLGSGVIVRSDGIILTNNHVVEDAREVIVTLSDDRKLNATVVGTDPKTDLAVLRVDAKNLPTLPLGRSSDLRVGDMVFAIGNPFAVGQSASIGMVSATGRTHLRLIDSGYENFIQTDAAINPGNSGGALIDGRGDLVGINTAIVARGSAGNQGLGFAVPVDMASRVMDQILEHGKVTRSQVGVVIQPLTPELAKAWRVAGTNGAVISQVMDDSPAERAGLLPEDVIVALDGREVTDSDQFRLEVSSRKPGSTARLGISRDGERIEKTVTLAEMVDGTTSQRDQPADDAEPTKWGLDAQDLNAEMRDQLGVAANVSGVVVVNVEDGSPADRAGLMRGDVIIKLNRQPVKDVEELRRLAKDAAKETALVLVLRRGAQVFLALEP